MSYTVTITTALGRTLSHTVETLAEACDAINTTHMARLVQILDNSNGEYFPEWAIRAILQQEAVV